MDLPRRPVAAAHLWIPGVVVEIESRHSQGLIWAPSGYGVKKYDGLHKDGLCSRYESSVRGAPLGSGGKARSRLKTLGRWGEGCCGHGDIIHLPCTRDVPEASDRILEEAIFVKRFSTTMTFREEWQTGTHLMLEGAMTFHTDGLKQNVNTGSNVRIQYNGRSLIWSAGPTAAVFQSEVL